MSINKKYIMTGMLAASIVVPMVDADNSYADDTRQVTERVNFRTGPGTSYESMYKIEKGENVTYLETSGEWIKIEHNSNTGYIHGDYISQNISTYTSTNVKYVNSTSGLNVRKGPSTSYAKITSLAHGTKVNVVSTSGDWSKITCGSITGYVSNQYLSSTTSGSTNSDSISTTTTTKYVDSSVGLNVRKGPGTSYARVTTLAHGTKVTVISTSNGWSKIESGSISGYVSSQYLSSTASGSTNSDSTSTTTTTKYVDSSAGLNVRKGPGTSYARVTTLAHGTKVTVISTSNGWSKIESGSISGYVSSQYLSSTASGSTNSDSTSTTTTIKYVDSSAGLNVRTGPGTSYSRVTTLAHGTKVTVKSTENGWSKIESGNISGYVSSQYLTSKAPSTSQDSSNSNTSSSVTASKVISYAKTLLGKPYVWGAQGPNGFDCSGFTYYVYKNAAGITLPRTSSQQSKYGKAVSKSNLQPGDLVFFDTVGSNNGVVTHCGIYIGGGQLIHAASGQGKVVINDMNSSYYQKAYVNARRVL